MKELSNEARKALVNTASGARGAKVLAPLPTLDELRAAGLIGLSGGLTQRGSNVRDREFSAALDAAF